MTEQLNLTNLSASERERKQALSLEAKVGLSKLVIAQVFAAVDVSKVAVAWTGGKDSTVLLWLIREVCLEHGWPLLQCLFVDEGDVFPEIRQFVDKLTRDWDLSVSVAHNDDVSSQVTALGEKILVSNLNKRNQEELKRLGFDQPSFPYQPESFVGNHLMKTVATNLWLEANDITHLCVGVRWDEQEARSEDDYLRPLINPVHTRIEPILHFLEKDIWGVIKQHQIPYVSLYEQGFRSLGAQSTTGKADSKPAWEQDLDNTTERSGRQQDKEKVMSRLRALGYM